MEDDLNLFLNGRRPQFFGNGRQPQFFENWRRPQFFCEWKTTLMFLGNGRRPQVFKNGRRPQIFSYFFLFKWKTPQFFVNKIIMQPETFQIETMVVAPLRVTLFVTIIMIFVLCSDWSIVIGYPGGVIVLKWYFNNYITRVQLRSNDKLNMESVCGVYLQITVPLSVFKLKRYEEINLNNKIQSKISCSIER